MDGSGRTVARLIVECLENEGVEVVFGLPGEENLHLIDAIADSSIRFVTTRDERGAAFMADTFGALTGRAGVCLSTLGPGALNLQRSRRVKGQSARAAAAGPVKIAIKPTRNTRRKLRRLGRATVSASITYTPEVALPSIHRRAIKLLKR